MKRALTILAMSCVCWYFAGSAHLQADIYTWTDEDGIRHYSTSPPSDANDPQVIFKEYQHNASDDQRRNESDQQELKTLIEQIEADEREAAEASTRREQKARKNRQPSMAERAAAEKKRLEEQIADLEEKPLEYFGSYDNKRNRLQYHRRQIENLARDPEEYFNNPEPFRGVIKTTEE